MIRGFTLIELLTVITIIAILATLLMTTLGSVKRKAREAVCTSNLHQIGIALHLYLDDFGKRPPDLGTLATAKYITDKLLTCPADRTRLLLAHTGDAISKPGAPPEVDNSASPPHVSYQHPLGWADEEWNRLMQASTRAGVVACPWHDVRAPKNAVLGTMPMEGLILRGGLDGTVVRRQVFPATSEPASPPTDRGIGVPTTAFAPGGEETDAISTFPPWELFSDEPLPQ
jgi:prepilin-type N-terminal cleavage/methylation domain-containing protein